MLNNFELQNFIFEKQASRIELINYIPKTKPTYKILIYRNHSFELIQNTIKPYLDYADIGSEFVYSDYDDSLSFVNLDQTSDLLILWLDLSRYSNSDIGDFINSRINYLKNVYKKNILFIPFEGEMNVANEQLVSFSLTSIKESLGPLFIDLRMEKFSGTKLSSLANMEISKQLGLKYIPALLKPSLKGIVVDLDNTLYKGVLGEDGIKGVLLTPEHKKLQARLKELSQQGFFLCVASKNDQQDVLDLFQQRSDFPLQLTDFTKICAHWNSKADSISDIATFLNVNPDSLLFIDDNMGELISVLQKHPNLRSLWAKEDAQKTLDVLNNFPGLLKLSVKREDAIRKNDTIANQQRQEMQQSLSKEDYIKNLKMNLTYDINNHEQIPRISELANKTNQFIFTYKRYSEQEVRQLMQGESAVVTISLKDNLSDSGIIGVIFIKKEIDYAIMEECFVSCRALGRGIDEAIVLGPIRTALNFLNRNKLKVDFKKGDRNLPAETFFNEYFSTHTSPATFEYEMPDKLISFTIKNEK